MGASARTRRTSGGAAGRRFSATPSGAGSPAFRAHLPPPNLNSQPAPGRPGSRARKAEGGRAAGGSAEDLERSGPRSPRHPPAPSSPVSRAAEETTWATETSHGELIPAGPSLRAPPRAAPAPARLGAPPRCPARRGALPWEKVSERVRIQTRRLSMLPARRAPPAAGPGLGERAGGAGRAEGSAGPPPAARPAHTRAHTHTLARTNSLPCPAPALSLFPLVPARSLLPRPFLSLPSPSPPPPLPAPSPSTGSRLRLYLSGSLSVSAPSLLLPPPS